MKVIIVGNLIEFITTASLYEKMEIIYPELKQLLDIHDGKIRFETFCPQCGDKKVFTYSGGLLDIWKANTKNRLASTGSLTSTYVEPSNPIHELSNLYLEFKCALNDTHKIKYFFAIAGDYLIKVGQYPSSADQELPQAKKYSSILGKQFYNELKRAIGLHAHGVGIGSFVYLRRIIGKLVDDASKEAVSAGLLTEEQFQSDGTHRNGMVEKIKLLKGFLPDLITENPQIYGIASKGVHELSEEECLKYFPVLKNGITMILDDIVAKKDKEMAAEKYRKSLNEIGAKLKG